MNPLTNVKNITKLNEIELAKGTAIKKSWHDMYKESAWIFIGGLAYGLTEGDILAVFSQFGEIVNLNLVRDKKTGKTKGFCFLCYANQKSTNLAVDNLNGIKLCNRTIRVDHVSNYKPPKEDEKDDELTKMLKSEGCAPKRIKTEESDAADLKSEKKKHGKHKKADYHDPMINEGLFEGDIMGIDPHADRNAVPKDSQRWPEGVVPYEIDESLYHLWDPIHKAMTHIEERSCIRFVQHTNERNYVRLYEGTGCWSFWGYMRIGKQDLSLGEFCEPFGTIVHELLHAIGFEHEHNRSDRDDHLIINWDNIEEKWFYAFTKLRPDQNRLLTPFDFDSIMLYGQYSFSKHHGVWKSMEARNGQFMKEVYSKAGMSSSDVTRLKMLYNC